MAVRRLEVMVVMVLVATTCCTPASVEPVRGERCQPAASSSSEDDIREVVLLRLFDRVYGHTRRPDVLFIGVEGGSGAGSDFLRADPSPELLRRFATHQPPVMPFSASLSWEHDRVMDPATGKLGTVYSVHSICWLSSLEVEVRAGHYAGTMSGSGFTFRLALERGTWVVKEESFDRVS